MRGEKKVFAASFAESLDRRLLVRYVNPRGDVKMLRKPLLLIMSAALLLWVNLNVCYTVSVGGQELPGL